jgi:hypothetical protein
VLQSNSQQQAASHRILSPATFRTSRHHSSTSLLLETSSLNTITSPQHHQLFATNYTLQDVQPAS